MNQNQGDEDQAQLQKHQEGYVDHAEQHQEQQSETIDQLEKEQVQIPDHYSELNNNKQEEGMEDFIQKSVVEEEEAKQDQQNEVIKPQFQQVNQIERRTITLEDQELQDISQMDQSLSSMNNNSESQIQDQNQQVNMQQQQQNQQQQLIDEEEENNNPLNPAEVYARMIGTMNNEPFLHEETLIGIIELLHLNSTEMFDEIDRNQPNWKEQIEQELKKRLEIYNKKVELISSIYQQSIPNNSMHNIEKIMSIIKSKEKEIYIYKIDKSLPLCCKHHHQKNNNEDNNQQDQEQKENDFDSRQDQFNGIKQNNEEYIEQSNQQDQENIICQDKLCDDFNHNHIKGQNENGDDDYTREIKQEQCQAIESNTDGKSGSNENLEELLQKEQGENLDEEQEYEVIDDKDDDISEENLEKLKKKLERNEAIRKKQEEQKQRLIEENQRLKREYEEMIEKDQKLRRDYQNQLQVENHLMQKQATLQVQYQQLQNLQQLNQSNLSDSQQNQNSTSNENEQLEQDNQNNVQKTEIIEEPSEIQSRNQSENQPELQTNQTQSEECHHSHHHHNQHNNHHHNHHHKDINEENQNQNHQVNNEQEENVNPAFQHSEDYNQHILPFKILGQSLSINHIHSIMSMQFVDLQRLKSLNPVENSITFEMNDNYLIKIKSCEHIKYDKSSLCSKIPHFIFKEHIFPFLSSVELFRVRSVSPEWRELVREVWHKTFKRDMQEQLLATDLCKEIEAQFKLMHIRNPFFQKLNLLIRAMVDVINWEEFEKKSIENKLSQTEKKIVVSLLRIIGYNILDYENINQFEEEEYDKHQVDIALHLKDFLNNSINHNGMSSQSLKNIFNNFLVQADISTPIVRNQIDKNFIIFILIAKQYYLYSLLRNYITSSSTYMQFAKNKLDALSKDWPTSKGFLEGAYRILLLRNVSIKNGEIVNNDSDDGEQFKINRKNKKTKKSKKMDLDKKKEEVNENIQEQINQFENQNEQGHSKVQNIVQNNSDLKQQNSEENSNVQSNTEMTQELNQREQSQISQSNTEMTQKQNQNEQSQISDQKKDDQQNINNKDEKEVKEKDDENDDDEEEEEDEEDGDQEQSQAELTQLMNSIFNLQQKENQEPDIVIKRKAGTMKIFLDQGTKLDIILNTIITYGMQTAHKQVAQEACNLVQNSKVTLERLEKTFNENQLQIDEMKIKSQQLEQSLLEKQAELEKVQLQNQQLHQEFQKDSQEIQQLQNTVRRQEDEIENYENSQSTETQDKQQENNQNIDNSEQHQN
ncbi:hypothetical protein TTHERM_00106880 (macronuclear) [Tetrahymena thermophila SB210]|uniref:F-box protein n=1 Tax=Tetrahymena thermophila (strain SB210) TaxID=312017 RepID=Q234B6_TETTS|nr:hypothetical protein TTHERM_00106880 [Tetrahymena thermophila SB210]EAR92087.2 hypothetical protein TTHERM_00106880 [Tetrahymena thermophila SB210]|eukprot:XP_001012332.2 hypothetical protein TTHERM_00106880 [Tetrahymena thermophila SB210]